MAKGVAEVDSMTGTFETKVRKSQPKPDESKRHKKKSKKYQIKSSVPSLLRAWIYGKGN